MIDSNKTFAANIKHLRGALSQTDFAVKIGATRGQVATYERGENRAKGKVELRICEVFSITREQLYESDLTKKKVTPINGTETLTKRIEKLEAQVELMVSLLNGKVKK